jgi:hypothetical protein
MIPSLVWREIERAVDGITEVWVATLKREEVLERRRDSLGHARVIPASSARSNGQGGAAIDTRHVERARVHFHEVDDRSRQTREAPRRRAIHCAPEKL